MVVKRASLLLFLLALVALPAFASTPAPVTLGPAGLVIAPGVHVQFGNTMGQVANITSQVSTNGMRIGTDWFTVNASLLAPTVILNWAYNYTYSNTKWVNTTCIGGCASSYTANWFANTTVIPGNVKFYQVAGTYITASPHWWPLNSTLTYKTAGNPTAVTIFVGSRGAPVSVHANGGLVSPSLGFVFSPSTQIITITNPGTNFSVSWAIPINAPPPGVGVPLLLILFVLVVIIIFMMYSHKVKKQIYAMMGGVMGVFTTGWVFTYGVFYDDTYTGGVWVDHIIDANLVVVLIIVVTVASFLSVFVERFE